MKFTMKIRRHGFIDGGFKRALLFKPPLTVAVEKHRQQGCKTHYYRWADLGGFTLTTKSLTALKREIGNDIAFQWLHASRNNYGPLAALRDAGKLREIVIKRCPCKGCKPNWMSAVQEVLDVSKPKPRMPEGRRIDGPLYDTDPVVNCLRCGRKINPFWICADCLRPEDCAKKGVKP